MRAWRAKGKALSVRAEPRPTPTVPVKMASTPSQAVPSPPKQASPARQASLPRQASCVLPVVPYRMTGLAGEGGIVASLLAESVAQLDPPEGSAKTLAKNESGIVGGVWAMLWPWLLVIGGVWLFTKLVSKWRAGGGLPGGVSKAAAEVADKAWSPGAISGLGKVVFGA